LEQKLEGILALLFTRLNYGGENGLGTGSLPGAVSAPVLAGADQGAHRALRAMVGGVQAWTIKKGKQIGTFPA
jgi:hypothetical protein